MIVKDEAHIILSTLTNIVSKVPLSSWLISDTGSTDETPAMIVDFFKDRNIDGQLVHHPWVDFAHNRTQALACAFNTSDFVMLFDADDTIVGTVPMPALAKVDRYVANFGEQYKYERPLFITNRKKWHYTGVLHEYLDSVEPRTSALLRGDFYVISGRSGARNKNPNKYHDDAVLLARAFDTETNLKLKTRYAFYCANSFKDARDKENAIEWYKRTLTLNGWVQEKYCSCMQLGYLYSGDVFKQIQYFSKASEYDPLRIEGVIEVMKLMYANNNHMMVNALYHKWRSYDPHPSGLFVNKAYYHYYMEYLNSISAYYVKDEYHGYQCAKDVIQRSKNKDWVAQSISNIKLYKLFATDNKMKQFIMSLEH
jgi:glycosyltransferase involved in cell wall biosynthesis